MWGGGSESKRKKKKSKKWETEGGNSETDPQMGKRVGASTPYPEAKKRMLSIKDVAGILGKEG